MTWFKVDDTLATHPKARKAGLAAMGLWSVCGAYASQHLTEGFVPDWYVKTWPQGTALAQKLVDAGLWSDATHDGEQGWQFHQWEERNPTKIEIEEKRASARERQREWREKKAASQRDKANGHSVSNDVTDTVTNAVSHASPDPTRPDPTQLVVPSGTTNTQKILPRKRGQRLERDWIPSEATRLAMAAECPNIDLRAEHAKFVDHWTAKTGRDATKLDWDATWRNWIRNAKPTANGHHRQHETDAILDAAMQRAIAQETAQ